MSTCSSRMSVSSRSSGPENAVSSTTNAAVGDVSRQRVWYVGDVIGCAAHGSHAEGRSANGLRPSEACDVERHAPDASQHAEGCRRAYSSTISNENPVPPNCT